MKAIGDEMAAYLSAGPETVEGAFARLSAAALGMLVLGLGLRCTCVPRGFGIREVWRA